MTLHRIAANWPVFQTGLHWNYTDALAVQSDAAILMAACDKARQKLRYPRLFAILNSISQGSSDIQHKIFVSRTEKKRSHELINANPC
jgi:hypothetical protein